MSSNASGTPKNTCQSRLSLSDRIFNVINERLRFRYLSDRLQNIIYPSSSAGVSLLRRISANWRNIFSRHFPNNVQIHGDGAQIAPPLKWCSSVVFRIARFSSVGSVQKPIRPSFSTSRRTCPIVFTSPWIFSAYAGAGLRRKSSIRLRIFRNKLLGTATSANWNVT